MFEAHINRCIVSSLAHSFRLKVQSLILQYGVDEPSIRSAYAALGNVHRNTAVNVLHTNLTRPVLAHERATSLALYNEALKRMRTAVGELMKGWDSVEHVLGCTWVLVSPLSHKRCSGGDPWDVRVQC